MDGATEPYMDVLAGRVRGKLIGWKACAPESELSGGTPWLATEHQAIIQISQKT